MVFDVIVTPQALSDLKEIGDYVANDDPVAAGRLVGRLLDQCDSLKDYPERGAPYQSGYRFITVRPYLIFYKVNRADAVVSVMAIIHGARRYRPGINN